MDREKTPFKPCPFAKKIQSISKHAVHSKIKKCFDDGFVSVPEFDREKERKIN